MKLNDVIFVDNLPKLDLHGLDSDTARVKINEFINDQYIMGNTVFVIVHGISGGILRQTTHETLKRNKRVVDYKTSYFNNGCTLVEIIPKVG